MRVCVLMENTRSSPVYCAEHGLSLYLETGGHKVLFDAGQSGAFAENAQKMGVDLAAVDAAVLSHGHYDHGGGLRAFLAVNDHAPVYCSRYAFDEHRNAAGKDIGLDPALAASPRLRYTGGCCRLAPGLTLYNVAARPSLFPIDPAGLTMRQGERLLPEDFRHEQYLLIREGNRRILVSGCSHRGIQNLVDWFSPAVLIGGFHFMNLDPDGAGRARLDEAALWLKSRETVYYTCHCTGLAQYRYLKRTLGDSLQYLASGQTAVL